MIREELFQKSTDILINAFSKGELRQGRCMSCAVGNLVCHAMGYKMKKTIWGFRWYLDGDAKSQMWGDVFATSEGKQDVHKKHFVGEAKKQILSTGYSLSELMRIEKAFEINSNNGDYDPTIYTISLGLLAVIKKLCLIHKVSTEEKIEAENRVHHTYDKLIGQ